MRPTRTRGSRGCSFQAAASLPNAKAAAEDQIYNLIKSYCEGGGRCYYRGTSRGGTTRLRALTSAAGRTWQVLCANDDTRRVGRGSPENRLSTRRGALLAYRRTLPIDDLKSEGGFTPRQRDRRVDSVTGPSQKRPLMDSTQPRHAAAPAPHA